MSLERVGGANDGGIDLRGWWWVPSSTVATPTPSSHTPRRRIRVLAQCKAEKKKISPKYVRELEGVLYRHQAFRDNSEEVGGSPSMAVFLSESTYTKSTILLAMSSPVPFLLLHMPPSESSDPNAATSALGSAIWNNALGGSSGLLGGAFDVRWEYDQTTTGGAGARPGLWLGNERVENWVPKNQ
jgi:hypothetical protein